MIRFKRKADEGIALIRESRDEVHVKRRILVPFALVVLFVVSSFVGGAYFFQERSQQESLEASTTAVERLFRLQLDKDADMMDTAIDALLNDPTLRAAMRANDAATLYARVRPLYEHLRADAHITHVYFTRADRVTLLRVHEPDRRGDIIDRVTMLDAAASGKEAYGLELGVLGTLTLRTVLPWRDETGALLGFVEMGEDVSQLIGDMRRILGVDLLMVVRKDLLDRDRWREGRRVLGLPDTWDDLARSVVTARTIDPIPAALASLLDARDPPAKAELATDQGRRELHAAFQPLLDVTGRQIGDIVLVRDVTAIQDTFRRSLALTAALSLLAGVAVFFLFVAVLAGVDRTYRNKRAIEHQFLLLTSEHERIIQIEKLSEVGKTIGEIAHQLNNPLVGVINMAQLAERSADDPDRTRSLLADIRRAGEDCRTFVRRMLDYTRISRSERQPVEMKGLIGETIALFQQSSTHRRVETELPIEPVILNVDPILVRHALFNLLSNAAQASEPETMITVRLATETVGDRDGWSLSVIDQGRGIPSAIMEQIFVPFFSTRAEGTGLGLPVVQHVAVLHGGRVAAANRPEGGAIFTIWLPVPEETT